MNREPEAAAKPLEFRAQHNPMKTKHFPNPLFHSHPLLCPNFEGSRKSPETFFGIIALQQ